MAQEHEFDSSKKARKTSYLLLLVLLGINLLNYFDRFIISQLLPLINEDFPMSKSVQGLLMTIFLVVYSMTCPIFGTLGDRFPRKYLVSFGTSLWSISTIMGGVVSSFGPFAFWRSMVGVGEAAYAPIAPTLISDIFPKRLHGRMMALFYMVTPLGAAFGFIVGGILGTTIGWRKTLFLAGILGPFLAIWILFFKEPKKCDASEHAVSNNEPTPAVVVKKESLSQTIKGYFQLFTFRRFLFACLGYTAYSFGIGSLQWWMPTYFLEVHNLPIKDSGIMLGGVTVIGGIVGALSGGFICDWLQGKVKNAYFTLCWVSCALSLPFVFTTLMTSNMTIMWSCLLTSEILLFMNSGPVNLLLMESVPIAKRATALSLAVLVMHMFGDAISPPIVGYFSDLYGMKKAMMIIPFSFIACAIFWNFGRTFNDDHLFKEIANQKS
jgi:MFS transporter, Spinster family, sphingosine-1-phosphate transporter